MRVCIEVEANFKAILNENKSSIQNLNMGIYRTVDVTHHLGSDRLVLSTWNGPKRVIAPFASWLGATGSGTGKSPHSSYNNRKHDRLQAFKDASMEQLIDALAGLLVAIPSQFGTHDFSAGTCGIAAGDDHHQEFSPAISSLFRIKFPNDWPNAEKHDFHWQQLMSVPDKFSTIDCDVIAIAFLYLNRGPTAHPSPEPLIARHAPPHYF